jgi:hypothetical protein
MHCPYCNANLVTAYHGELQCSDSKALFSVCVSEVLLSRYGHHDSHSQAIAPSTIGQWFCPGCGVKMHDTDCNACGQSFDLTLIRQLVELNPHIGGV